MIFLITDDILKSRTDYMEEFKRLPNSIQQRVSNWTLSSMKRMWAAEIETRRGRKSCSGGKAVGSYFFSPVDLKIWCWMFVLWAWKTMTRGLFFQSCGSPLYLPVSMLTKGALWEMWFTSVRLSSLTILAAKARAPASAIRTGEASLSWACTYKARWWIGRGGKKRYSEEYKE